MAIAMLSIGAGSVARSAPLSPAPSQPGVAASPGCETFFPSPYEVCGAILDKYKALGGPQSFLLLPKSNERPAPDGAGAFSEFVGGNIYWSPSTSAHPVAHDFLTKWGQYGYEAGFMRYPTTDEIVLGDGVSRRQEFEGASIYFSFVTGAHEVHGLIRQAWVDLGAETSFLGFPTSDEQDTPPQHSPWGGRESLFQTGVVTANLTNNSTHVGNWSIYPTPAPAGLTRTMPTADRLPALRAQDLPEATVPTGRAVKAGDGCPEGTTDYSKINKAEWNCESVSEDLSYYEVMLRKGEARGARIDDDSAEPAKTAGFGRLHAGEDHNIGPHTIQLIARDSQYCSPLGYQNRCSYTMAFHFDKDFIDNITVVVQQHADTEGRSPDSHDLGVVTAYCGIGNPADHRRGYCRDDIPPPFNGGKKH
ncbi:hypothetical protein [Kitasatospora sp. NPDC088351]|uniref:LGFP repeat-containing protein n=1 Tax=unclassified Kitasatospora TaxID=2633591 RepID=UPI00341886C1